MSEAEEYPQKHSPRWLLNKIKKSKHDGESLGAIIEFQEEIINDAIKSRVESVSDNTQKAIDKFTSLQTKYPRMATVDVVEMLKRFIQDLKLLK